MSQTVKLHRVLKANPEKVFRAFSDANAYSCWLPPYGYVCTVEKMDFRIDGEYKMTFINFSTENKQSFGGKFVDIQTNKSIKYTDRFDDPGLPGEMTTTVTFNATSVGTEIHITQENIPVQIPAEMCYLGWQESLEKLKNLVEPNIPDA